MATKKSGKSAYEREMDRRRKAESELADKYYGKNMKRRKGK